MVIPWIGVPLSSVLKKVRAAAVGEVRRVHDAHAADRDAGLRAPAVLEWPYVEGLRMDEAMHPLTLMVVGLYGKVLPNQNGAPLRVHIPWKYGFKSGKSIVRIRLHGQAAGEHVGSRERRGIRVLRQRESDGRSSALVAGAREAAAGPVQEPADADVQRLRRPGGEPVRRHGPAEVLLMRRGLAGPVGDRSRAIVELALLQACGLRRLRCVPSLLVAYELCQLLLSGTHVLDGARRRSRRRRCCTRPGRTRCTLLLLTLPSRRSAGSSGQPHADSSGACSASGRSPTRCCHLSMYLVFDQLCYSWATCQSARSGRTSSKRPFIFVGHGRVSRSCCCWRSRRRGWVRRLEAELAAAAPARLRRRRSPAIIHFIWVQKSDIREPLRWAVWLAVLLGFRVVLGDPEAPRQARPAAVSRLRHSGFAAKNACQFTPRVCPLVCRICPLATISARADAVGAILHDGQVARPPARIGAPMTRRWRVMHKPIKYVEKGLTFVAKGAWAVFEHAQQHQAERVVHPEVVGEAAAQVVAEGEAAARLAARDRLAVPDLRARGAPGDPRRQARLQGAAHREDRRDQGARSSSATARS